MAGEEVSGARAAFRIEYALENHWPRLICAPWEWTTDEATICGYIYWPILPCKQYGGKWATLLFENGYIVNWAWGSGDQAISVWDGTVGDWRTQKFFRHDATPDDVLRCVLRVAARERVTE